MANRNEIPKGTALLGNPKFAPMRRNVAFLIGAFLAFACSFLLVSLGGNYQSKERLTFRGCNGNNVQIHDNLMTDTQDTSLTRWLQENPTPTNQPTASTTSTPGSLSRVSVRILNAWTVSNTYGFSADLLVSSPDGEGLEKAYVTFVAEAVAELNSEASTNRALSLRTSHNYQRFLVVTYDPESAEIVDMEDSECPPSALQAATCQTVYGQFELFTDENADAVYQRYFNATQSAIQGGRLQDQLEESDFGNVLFIEGAVDLENNPIENAAAAMESDNRGDDGGGVGRDSGIGLLGFVLIFASCVIVVVAIIAAMTLLPKRNDRVMREAKEDRPEDKDSLLDNDLQNSDTDRKFREQVEELVTKNCPQEKENIDAMIAQFMGREDELIKKLESISPPAEENVGGNVDSFHSESSSFHQDIVFGLEQDQSSSVSEESEYTEYRNSSEEQSYSSEEQEEADRRLKSEVEESESDKGHSEQDVIQETDNKSTSEEPAVVAAVKDKEDFESIESSEMAHSLANVGKKINVNDLHNLLGHPSEDTTRKTGKYYGLIVVGKFLPCSLCNEGNARQKTLPETWAPEKVDPDYCELFNLPKEGDNLPPRKSVSRNQNGQNDKLHSIGKSSTYPKDIEKDSGNQIRDEDTFVSESSTNGNGSLGKHRDDGPKHSSIVSESTSTDEPIHKQRDEESFVSKSSTAIEGDRTRGSDEYAKPRRGVPTAINGSSSVCESDKDESGSFPSNPSVRPLPSKEDDVGAGNETMYTIPCTEATDDQEQNTAVDRSVPTTSETPGIHLSQDIIDEMGRLRCLAEERAEAKRKALDAARLADKARELAEEQAQLALEARLRAEAAYNAPDPESEMEEKDAMVICEMEDLKVNTEGASKNRFATDEDAMIQWEEEPTKTDQVVQVVHLEETPIDYDNSYEQYDMDYLGSSAEMGETSSLQPSQARGPPPGPQKWVHEGGQWVSEPVELLDHNESNRREQNDIGKVRVVWEKIGKQWVSKVVTEEGGNIDVDDSSFESYYASSSDDGSSENDNDDVPGSHWLKEGWEEDERRRRYEPPRRSTSK